MSGNGCLTKRQLQCTRVRARMHVFASPTFEWPMANWAPAKSENWHSSNKIMYFLENDQNSQTCCVKVTFRWAKKLGTNIEASRKLNAETDDPTRKGLTFLDEKLLESACLIPGSTNKKHLWFHEGQKVGKRTKHRDCAFQPNGCKMRKVNASKWHYDAVYTTAMNSCWGTVLLGGNLRIWWLCCNCVSLTEYICMYNGASLLWQRTFSQKVTQKEVVRRLYWI